MGILADVFLSVVDPVLKVTVDPLRRGWRKVKIAAGDTARPEDYSSVSSNTGRYTLVARNIGIGWLLYKHQPGRPEARWVIGTEMMCTILNDERDSGAYPAGRPVPENDISKFSSDSLRRPVLC